jgi:hypothetical protein
MTAPPDFAPRVIGSADGDDLGLGQLDGQLRGEDATVQGKGQEVGSASVPPLACQEPLPMEQAVTAKWPGCRKVGPHGGAPCWACQAVPASAYCLLAGSSVAGALLRSSSAERTAVSVMLVPSRLVVTFMVFDGALASHTQVGKVHVAARPD